MFSAYYLSVIVLKKTIFIKNAAVLTASGFILRFIGVIFKVWLASVIGSEGIGLYQIVFSVFTLAATFATSGISTAVTRLCAEEIAFGNKKSVKRVLFKCVTVTLIVALVSSFLLIFGAQFISEKILSEPAAYKSILVSSISLPFMGVCSCFRGYFIARRKATSPAVSQIFEQTIRICVIFIAIKYVLKKGIGYTCAAVMLGDAVAEACTCGFLYISYRFDTKKLNRLKGRNLHDKEIYGRIGEIALPITAGRYLGSALRTTENILIPKLLKKFKHASQTALSQFGMIKGMALPLVFFPSTLLNSLSLLLVPELTEALKKNQPYIVKSTVKRALLLTSAVSYIFSAIFFICGKEIGIIIYKNENVGVLIQLLSPIVPLMYLDSICDGMLKGLNEQKFTFFTTVSDSAIRIALIIPILPVYGLKGFIAIMYFSNAYTSILNINRLFSASNIKPDYLKSVFIPISSAFLSVLLVDTALKSIANLPVTVYVGSVILLSTLIYIFLLHKTVDFSFRELL